MRSKDRIGHNESVFRDVNERNEAERAGQTGRVSPRMREARLQPADPTRSHRRSRDRHRRPTPLSALVGSRCPLSDRRLPCARPAKIVWIGARP